MLTLHKITYRNQCLDRIYLPRKDGGLGLTIINHAYRATIVSIGQYLLTSSDKHLKVVTKHHTEALSQQTLVIKLASIFCLEEIKRN